MKKLRYIFEGALVYSAFYLFKILPWRVASKVGAKIGAALGPHMRSSDTARQNIDIVFPDMDDPDKAALISAIWANAGRVFAEYPHLEDLAKHHMKLEGLERIQDVLESERPAIFIGLHQGNWELNCISSLFHFPPDKRVDITYRAPNNPYVDALLKKARTLNGALKTYPKARKTGKLMIKAMRDGHYLGILLDQKYNEGLSIPFFGRPTMTNPIAVELASKYKAALIPVQNIRLDDGTYKLVIHPPLCLDDNQSSENLLTQIQTLFEGWIRAYPDQWLWMHDRWGFKNTKD